MGGGVGGGNLFIQWTKVDVLAGFRLVPIPPSSVCLSVISLFPDLGRSLGLAADSHHSKLTLSETRPSSVEKQSIILIGALRECFLGFFFFPPAWLV